MHPSERNILAIPDTTDFDKVIVKNFLSVTTKQNYFQYSNQNCFN